MSDTAHIRDLLTAEEYAEHQRLARQLKLLELASSTAPMSQRDLAELLGLSQKSISIIERRGKTKLRDLLLPLLKPNRP